MQNFFNLSGGNIGMALKFWLCSIEKVDENKLYLNPITEPELPAYPDEIWQSLLFQFQIHQKISKTDLIKIYGQGNMAWITRYTNQLAKAGLLEVSEKDVFLMPSEIRYFIEKNYAS